MLKAEEGWKMDISFMCALKPLLSCPLSVLFFIFHTFEKYSNGTLTQPESKCLHLCVHHLGTEIQAKRKL